MKLLIVESPAKANTIEKYLGSDFVVSSSVGHIRDLAIKGKGGLGVDVENNFEPTYAVIKGKQKIITELKKSAKEADEVFLATDPDREGEAISWHLYDALGLKEEKTERVVFHEITKNAVLEAMKHPRKINMDLVESQETRRILDRIIGFKLSGLLQNKIKSKSAGRVQSVVLKLICDLEEKIQAFKPEEYWVIDFDLPPKATLTKYNGKKIEIKTEVEANTVLEALNESFTVAEVTKKESKRKAKPAYITSTLQQDATNKLSFSSKRTMMVAQKLYEGIEIGGETVGLITYMRTDSTRLSDDFVSAAKSFISDEYGKKYYKGHSSKKSELSQDAHEAIRPSSVDRHPERIKSYLKADEYKLYKLIYSRAVASLMVDAVFDDTKIVLENNGYEFELKGKIKTFDGYLAMYPYDETKDQELPAYKEQDTVTVKEVVKTQKFTQPPARFTEATLIKKMEEAGIGRPSTYAQTLDTIQKRGYVKLEEKKFHPTEQGLETTKQLTNFFDSIVNVDYTKEMEEHLDEIAGGEAKGPETLRAFYDQFSPMLEHAYENMDKKEAELVGRKCPECGGELVKRIGRYGEFIACQNYPDCKYIEKQKKEVVSTGVTCPNCGEGELVVRTATKGRNKGKHFYACNRFPKCKYIVNDEPTKQKCTTCDSIMLKGESGVYCADKDCDTNKKS